MKEILIGLSVCIFLVALGFLVVLVLYYQENNGHNTSYASYRSNINIPMMQTNRLFTGSEDVDFIGIGLQKRKTSHFDVLAKKLQKSHITLQYFEGINGKEIKLQDYNLAPQYLHFFENNIREREAGKTDIDYRGHLGCTLSHLAVISNVERMTVIFEDDADLVPDFRVQLEQTLADVTRYDPQWEILVLGFSAKYDDHMYHKLNDVEPIYPGGIVKLHYWIGLWAYVIRNKQTAQKILSMFNPMPWHIDLTIADNVRRGKIKAYGRVPPIANHPGWLRLSSWDVYQYGDPSKIKTDTNH